MGKIYFSSKDIVLTDTHTFFSYQKKERLTAI